VEDPLSEALIAGNINERPAFLEVYLENNQLYYRPIGMEGVEKPDGILLYS
jgi:ATP-dependent Clp protease ATP-binding subunit ClpC